MSAENICGINRFFKIVVVPLALLQLAILAFFVEFPKVTVWGKLVDLTKTTEKLKTSRYNYSSAETTDKSLNRISNTTLNDSHAVQFNNVLYNMELPVSVQSSIPEVRCESDKFLIYTCSQTCGGFGDREKGMTSAFLLALLTNRTFLIDMKKPCELGELLQANLYNWKKCRHIIKEKGGRVLQYMDRGGKKFGDSIPGTDFNQIWTERIIRLKINAIVVENIRIHPDTQHRIPWLPNKTREEIIGYVLGILFRADDRISEHYLDIKRNHLKGRTLVCAHIRMGKNPSIPKDNVLQQGSPNADKMLTFLESFKNSKKYMIYVATDSENIRKKSKDRISNLITRSMQIIHIDRSPVNKTSGCEGFRVVILEQFLLSRCDVLLLSRSNFGAMASYMRGHSSNLYLYQKLTHNIRKVNISEIQNIFKFV